MKNYLYTVSGEEFSIETPLSFQELEEYRDARREVYTTRSNGPFRVASIIRDTWGNPAEVFLTRPASCADEPALRVYATEVFRREVEERMVAVAPPQK